MTWPLPPAIEWPRFLRLLRNPAPPSGWLEAAAELEELQKRPLLLRWIAQHPKAPAHLRARLLPRLPWRALAAVALDASAHPQARAFATERLQNIWPGLTMGERRALAPLAPKALWRLIWKVPDAGVIQAFLQNPRLHESGLLALFQAPLLPTQLAALEVSTWKEQEAIALRILQLLDETLLMVDMNEGDRPVALLPLPPPRAPHMVSGQSPGTTSGPQVVLGHAAHWIKVLEPEARLLASTIIRHPALRRLVRAHSGVGTMEE